MPRRRIAERGYSPAPNSPAKCGLSIPAGIEPFKAKGTACPSRTPGCQTAFAAINANTVAVVRVAPTGTATFPGVAPGTYFVSGSAAPGGHLLHWNLNVNLKAGAYAVTLDQHNTMPGN